MSSDMRFPALPIHNICHSQSKPAEGASKSQDSLPPSINKRQLSPVTQTKANPQYVILLNQLLKLRNHLFSLESDLKQKSARFYAAVNASHIPYGPQTRKEIDKCNKQMAFQKREMRKNSDLEFNLEASKENTPTYLRSSITKQLQTVRAAYQLASQNVVLLGEKLKILSEDLSAWDASFFQQEDHILELKDEAERTKEEIKKLEHDLKLMPPTIIVTGKNAASRTETIESLRLSKLDERRRKREAEYEGLAAVKQKRIGKALKIQRALLQSANADLASAPQPPLTPRLSPVLTPLVAPPVVYVADN